MEYYTLKHHIEQNDFNRYIAHGKCHETNALIKSLMVVKNELKKLHSSIKNLPFVVSVELINIRDIKLEIVFDGELQDVYFSLVITDNESTETRISILKESTQNIISIYNSHGKTEFGNVEDNYLKSTAILLIMHFIEITEFIKKQTEQLAFSINFVTEINKPEIEEKSED